MSCCTISVCILENKLCLVIILVEKYFISIILIKQIVFF